MCKETGEYHRFPRIYSSPECPNFKHTTPSRQGVKIEAKDLILGFPESKDSATETFKALQVKSTQREREQSNDDSDNSNQETVRSTR